MSSPPTRPLPESPARPAQSTRPTRTRTGRCSPSGHPLRPAARPHPSQSAALPASVPPPTPWLLAKPCSYLLKCCACSASSSLLHRRRPAPARRRDARWTSCRSRRGPTAHRAGSPCPGSRGRVLRPCGHRAGTPSPLMIRLCHSRVCRHTDEHGCGLRCDAQRA